MILGFLNTPISHHCMDVINPTMQVNVGDALKLPFVKFDGLGQIHTTVSQLIELSKNEWNSMETSFDFKANLLLSGSSKEQTIQSRYTNLAQELNGIRNTVHDLEIENNRLFILAYGLQNELNPEIPWKEITLTNNPYNRYGGSRTEEDLKSLLKADTMKEFVSYAVGCMFGRYSLDKPGLLLANQGETLQDYLRQVPEPSFLPDEDNVLPVLDGEWFNDDITERFKKFLRVTFGDEHYSENLAFIEEAIGRDIRGYFVKEFYKEHVQMYKKRPIYWMFSSAKGSFNVLVYMHRYKPDTVSVILNKYLREFRGKLEARKSYLEQVSISASASPREKTSALKEIENLNKILEELRVYERDVLYPLATQRLEIDLDDGVKVNYAKFGSALQKIVGL